MEEGDAYCAGGEEDEGGVDKGFVPEENGEDGAEEFLVGGSVDVWRVADGDGNECLEEDPGEGLEGEEAAYAEEVALFWMSGWGWLREVLGEC